MLADEGIDPQGRWYQRFEIIIKPGGTLAGAARAVYGDERRVEELIKILHQRNPNVDPARVPVGLKLGVTVDPAVTFVVKESRREGDWEIYSYFNGVKEWRRANARVVELPTGKPAKEFAVPGDTSDKPLPGGSRLLEYQYRATETFEQAVSIVYGNATIKAMQHFIAATGVDINNWPPPPNDRLRIVVAPGLTFEDDPIQEVPMLTATASRSPEAGALLAAQDEERRNFGIYRVKADAYGTTYRLRILNGEVSARQVAGILYNDPEQWKEVAESAGFKLAKEDTATNFKLQGREFELYLDYEEEWFPAEEPQVDEKNSTRLTRLVNGTQVLASTKGPNRVVVLPSGCRKIVYQPSELALAIARVAAHAGGNGEEGAAQLLWDWDPGVPRQPGMALQNAALTSQKQQTLLKVTVEPRQAQTNPVDIVRQFAPCLFAVGAVFLGTFLVILVGQMSRPKPYMRRRW